MSDGPVTAGHRLGGDEGVDDRLLGRLHRRLEERVEPSVHHGPDIEHPDAVGLPLGWRQAAIARGEGQEEVARRRRTETAHAGDPQLGPASDAAALMGKQRRVGRDDADDRTAPGTPVGDADALTRPRARHLRDGDLLADRHAVDPEQAAASIVRLHEHPDGPAAKVAREAPGRGPDAALELMADHARPAADVALRDVPAARPRERRRDVLRPHVAAGDVVQLAVVGLAGNGQAPVRRCGVVSRRSRRDERVADLADVVRVRYPDCAGEQPGLTDPLQAGQLAVPIERRGAGEDGLRPDVAVVGQDDRHAGADRPAPDDQPPLTLDQGGVADPDPGDVRDRVARPGRALADHDAEIAGSGGHAQSTWLVETTSTPSTWWMASMAAAVEAPRPRSDTSTW